MSESTVRALFETVASSPDLQHRFTTAADASELRAAVAAAGFDPDTPDIAQAIDSVGELSETDLAATTGGSVEDIVMTGLASALTAGLTAIANFKTAAELHRTSSQW